MNKMNHHSKSGESYINKNYNRNVGENDYGVKKEFTEEEETDVPQVVSKDSETNIYFMHALETLKQISGEEREYFIQNVLEQTAGQELQLSCESASSRCLEILLQEADDMSIIMRFMKAFAEDIATACADRFASHVTESLLYYGLRSMQNWFSDIEAAENNKKCSEKANQVMFVITWIHSLGEFCLIQLNVVLEDTCSCHILRAVIQALGGYYIHESINQSKRAKEWRKNFEEYLGSQQKVVVKESIALDSIPTFFVTVLKQITKAFMKLDKIKAYAVDPKTAPIIQVFLYVLKNRLPKRCEKFINCVSENLFDSTASNGVPDMLMHKNCSYVMEKIFDSATEEMQSDLWENYIEPFLGTLVAHCISNFIVQRIFDVVSSKVQFERMCNSLFNHFDLILESHHYGLWVSVATACNRMKAQQAQFMQKLMLCLGCWNSERQLYLVRLLLHFDKYDTFVIQDLFSSANIYVTLQGSLLIQAILKFQKPVKIVKSILSMKPDEIAFLASHAQGCYILPCFMESISVGEKNKDRFLQHLKPVLKSLACSYSSSLTLSRMWVLMTLKQKSYVAEELWNHNHLLQASRCGFGVSRKFGLYYYKHKNDKWKEIQQNLMKKRERS